MSRDAAVILGAIATLMITHFGIHAFGAVAGGAHARPATRSRGRWPAGWRAWPGRGAACCPRSAGGSTCVVLLAFLNYLLYSKHSHIIGRPAQHLLPQPRPARGAAQAEPRGGRHGPDRHRLRVQGLHLEVAARHLRLHRVRALHQLLPGLQHRQAAVAHARGARRARRPQGEACPTAGPLDDLLERMQHGDEARPSSGEPHPAGRRPHHRGGAVGLHHLRRLPGGLPGVHRSARA